MQSTKSWVWYIIAKARRTEVVQATLRDQRNTNQQMSFSNQHCEAYTAWNHWYLRGFVPGRRTKPCKYRRVFAMLKPPKANKKPFWHNLSCFWSLFDHSWSLDTSRTIGLYEFFPNSHIYIHIYYCVVWGHFWRLEELKTLVLTVFLGVDKKARQGGVERGGHKTEMSEAISQWDRPPLWL